MASKTKTYTLFGTKLKIDDDKFAEIVSALRIGNELNKVAEGASEQDLLEMLAVERHSRNRTFVRERLYIKFSGERSSREKIELLSKR